MTDSNTSWVALLVKAAEAVEAERAKGFEAYDKGDAARALDHFGAAAELQERLVQLARAG